MRRSHRTETTVQSHQWACIGDLVSNNTHRRWYIPCIDCGLTHIACYKYNLAASGEKQRGDLLNKGDLLVAWARQKCFVLPHALATASGENNARSTIHSIT